MSTSAPDVTRPLPKSARPAPVGFRLTVTEGPDRGATFEMAPCTARILIGSGLACAFRLTDPAVSRRHVALTTGDGAVRVQDLQSTNGVFVAGLRIVEAWCGGGESLQIGASTILVEPVSAISRGSLSKKGSFGRVLGGSAAMRVLYPVLERLAESTLPVLVEGEVGTGKELAAEAIHEQSARAAGTFLVCDATSDEADRALFGAEADPGLLEQAAGGTLLVDHVTELDDASQARLATFLRGEPVVRADGSILDRVDTRVIATSRKDVDQEVQRNLMREDLANILCRARVELPPLRDREGDIPLLARYFWGKLEVADRVIPDLSMRRFASYAWPGNVAELAATVARLAATGDDGVNPLAVYRDPHAPIGELAESLLAADLPLIQARTVLGDEFDRRYLRKVLARYNGNVSHAAGASGIARRYFQTLKAKLNVPAKRAPMSKRG